MSRKLVVNLLVYADLVKEGAKQAELLPRVASAQAQAAEVRREWILNLPEELPALAQGAKENGLELFYSIPVPLFAAGRLEEELLQTVYAEARQMGATRIKFAVGNFAAAAAEELQKLAVLAFSPKSKPANPCFSLRGKVNGLPGFLEAQTAETANYDTI